MMLNRTTIIAEAGINHNGKLDLALKLIDVAVKSGADIVKFQTFSADALVTVDAEMAEYQKKNTTNANSQFEMLRNLELSMEDLIIIRDYCHEKNIEFLSTAFDVPSLEVLIDLGCKRIKIASGEMTNKPFLDAAASFNLPILLSTGMASMDEIEWAVSTLLNKGLDKSQLTVLHCTTNYPAKPEELNLLAIKSIAGHFDLSVGYSDHSLGTDASLSAISLGSSVIEKHITLDIEMNGPDHAASMNPTDFADFIRRIRRLESSLGNGIKTPHDAEIANRLVVRKSIVALKIIRKGDIFSQDNITTKRPGTGISARYYSDMIGRKANRNYNENELIDDECLK